MGIDLEDKTGSCCLWELYFHLFPRPWRTESSQGLIRACQGWCLHRNADSEPCWKEASNPGLERFSGLLKVTLLVKFSSPGKQSGKLETCPPLTVWPQFMVPFWAAVSSALRDRVCLFACPAILTSPGSQQSAVCWCPHHLPFPAPQPEPSPPLPWESLGRLIVTLLTFGVTDLQGHPSHGLCTTHSTVVNGTNGPDTNTQVTILEWYQQRTQVTFPEWYQQRTEGKEFFEAIDSDFLF